MPPPGSVLASLQWPWEVGSAALFMGEKSEVQRCSLSCGQLPGAWWTPGTCEVQTHVPMRRVSARLGSFLDWLREAGPHGEV